MSGITPCLELPRFTLHLKNSQKMDCCKKCSYVVVRQSDIKESLKQEDGERVVREMEMHKDIPSFRNVCLHELSFLRDSIYKLPVKVYTLPNTNTYSVFRLFSWLL